MPVLVFRFALFLNSVTKQFSSNFTNSIFIGAKKNMHTVIHQYVVDVKFYNWKYANKIKDEMTDS